MSFAGRRIAIVGAGREGLATLEYLRRHGADNVAVLDANPETPVIKGIPMLTGPNYLKNLQQYELIFRSPGVPYLTPEIQAAKAVGTEISSHMKLFLANCRATVIGVSGTKGKGTTCGLIHAMLQAAGKRSFLGGNIGVPPLTFLDDVGSSDVVVLELSSFQLQDLTLSPPISVLTNLTEDHLSQGRSVAEYNRSQTKSLDYHLSLEEYHLAKANLFAHQRPSDTAIFNRDDAGSCEIADQVSHGATRWFSIHKPADGMVRRDQVVVMNEKVLPIEDIPVPGPHNRANVLAACLAAHAVGVPLAAMAEAVRSYRGLPYHLELVGEHHGIRFFNDSYATNPTATIPALESFDDPIVLIAGGYERGLDVDHLASVILERTKAVILIGEVGQRLGKALTAVAKAQKRGAPAIKYVSRKEEVLPASLAFAQSGDVILFSPAAASFDWFKNFTERGRFFTEQVHRLSATADDPTPPTE